MFYSFDTLYSSYARFIVAWQPGGSGVYSLADLVDVLYSQAVQP